MSRLAASLTVLLLGGCGRTQLFDGAATGQGGGTTGPGGAGGGTTQPTCVPPNFDAGDGEGFGDGPPPRELVPAMAWDEAHRRVVALGPGQTWEWNGAGWKHHTAAPHPTGWSSTAMAWDGVGCRVILFGGTANGLPLDETWAWDGDQWTQLHPARAPSARSLHAMAWDPARQRIVLFGGQDADGTLLGDTWEWVGSSWERASPAQSPPVSATHAMAFDAVNLRVMATATTNTVSTWGSSNGSWEWSGSSWVLVATNPATPPSCEIAATIAADPIERRLVWLCGSSNQTWVWNGASWTMHQQAFTSRFYEGALVWEGRSGRVMALVQTPIIFSMPVVVPPLSWWNGTGWDPR